MFCARKPRAGGSVAASLSRLVPSVVIASLVAASAFADDFRQSPDGAWFSLDAEPAPRQGLVEWIRPDNCRVFELTSSLLLETLAQAPLEDDVARVEDSPTILHVPRPDGTYERFAVVASPIWEPGFERGLAPDTMTYLGQGIDDPSATIRCDWTEAGFHAAVLTPLGAYFVDPWWAGDTTTYSSYFVKGYRSDREAWACETPNDAAPTVASASETPRVSNGTLRRNFRMACAGTAEYTAFVSAPSAASVALGQAAVVTAMNRVNQVFEREVAVRFVLVANNSSLIFTNAAGDGYTNGNASAMMAENQTKVDTVIGDANYDIGHVFGTNSGGVAQALGIVCTSTQKARGVTGSGSPTGDPFWVDYVCHEVGHQMGAAHTFNSNAGFCGAAGQYSATTAYEIGSGTTIMGYAGPGSNPAGWLCGADSVQNQSDAYFHHASIEQMITRFGVAPMCATTTATNNSLPTVTTGANVTIPFATPFTLTATGNDTNGDTITYCWEERDLGPSQALAASDNGSSPIFRSRNPSLDASRTFPQLSTVLANTIDQSEKYPQLARSGAGALKFRCYVRDNRAGGGGINSVDRNISVTTAAGPFNVTSPNTAVTWTTSPQTVTWNVAGTTANGVNTANVNILLSIDGGVTYPYLLLANTPNDGTQQVHPPALTNATECRIKVEAAGNVFFDVSNVDFTINIATCVPQALSALEAPLPEEESAREFGVNAIEPGTGIEALEGLVGDPRYLTVTRWTTTATNSSIPTRTKFTITYSFPPDTATVNQNSSISGSVTGPNTWNAQMNAGFGAEATWKNLVRQCMDRLQELTCITFTEVTETGTILSLPTNNGSNAPASTRGDIRFAMRPLSNADIIGYSYAPQAGGDIVLDQADLASFTQSANNFRFFRNAIMRQVCISLGMVMVRPTNGTKLLEETIVTTFDGPQEDDIRGLQWIYGDKYEPNETALAASFICGLALQAPPPDQPAPVLQEEDWSELTPEERERIREFFYYAADYFDERGDLITDFAAADEGGNTDGEIAPVIYGADNRLEWHQVTNPTHLALARSTVLVTDRSKLTQESDGRWRIATTAWSTVSVGGNPLALCAAEPYRNQVDGGFCSGFLVAPDIIVTAGHCTADTAEAQTQAFVFAFAMQSSGTTPTRWDVDQVYFGSKLIARQLVGNGADYAVIRLDRPVTRPEAVPLFLRRSGAIANGTQVGVIGHPQGILSKVAFDAGGNTVVRSITNPDFFVANLDTYQGNSGSAVFNTTDFNVEGILVRGDNDFVNSGGCAVSQQNTDIGGRGEDVTRTSVWMSNVPDPENDPVKTVEGCLETHVERDFYSFDVNDTKLRGTITLFPVGTTYQFGAVPVAPNPEVLTSVNAAEINDLSMELIDRDGSTVLARAAGTGKGRPEVIAGYDFTTRGPGRYYIRVYTVGADAAQRYKLSIRGETSLPTTLEGTTNFAGFHYGEQNAGFNFTMSPPGGLQAADAAYVGYAGKAPAGTTAIGISSTAAIVSQFATWRKNLAIPLNPDTIYRVKANLATSGFAANQSNWVRLRFGGDFAESNGVTDFGYSSNAAALPTAARTLNVLHWSKGASNGSSAIGGPDAPAINFDLIDESATIGGGTATLSSISLDYFPRAALGTPAVLYNKGTGTVTNNDGFAPPSANRSSFNPEDGTTFGIINDPGSTVTFTTSHTTPVNGGLNITFASPTTGNQTGWGALYIPSPNGVAGAKLPMVSNKVYVMDVWMSAAVAPNVSNSRPPVLRARFSPEQIANNAGQYNTTLYNLNPDPNFDSAKDNPGGLNQGNQAKRYSTFWWPGVAAGPSAGDALWFVDFLWMRSGALAIRPTGTFTVERVLILSYDAPTF